jgi:mono/diheme cytochrome c family protein
MARRSAPTAALPRRRTRACAQIALCVAFAACASRAGATEAELSLTVGGRTMTYARASLLGMPAATTISIPRDALYRRAMSFRALPAATLLSDVGGDESVRFSGSDGPRLILPAALLLTRPGAATAYLAVETDDAPWPNLETTPRASAGPFYLVWTTPERSGVTSVLWAARVTHIEVLPSLARRFPMLAPAATSAKSPVRRGFLVYVRQCSVCHALNGGGDSNIGPDLNIPYNPTEYLRIDALRRLIRDPQSLHRWPESRMPAYSKSALSDRDLTDLVDYLRYMADRKIVAVGQK